jgi:hypothetical protein
MYITIKRNNTYDNILAKKAVYLLCAFQIDDVHFFSIYNDLTALNYVTTTILVTYVIIYMRLQNITLLVY